MASEKIFPYRFDGQACKTCGGKCCRGQQGYVWVSPKEIGKMAETMQMDAAIFAKKYLSRVDGRFSLREHVINGEHFCCFFDLIDCRCKLYAVRPEQCRTYPFWNEFKKAPERISLECPGVKPIDPGSVRQPPVDGITGTRHPAPG